MRVGSYRITCQTIIFLFANLGLIVGFTGLIYPFFYCHASPSADAACPLGVLENASLELTIGVSGFLWFIYLVSFLGLLGALFGRTFCGFACPIGFLQDGISRVRRRWWRRKFHLPTHLRYLKYLLLLAIPIISYLTGRLAFTEICPVGGLTATLPTLILYPQKFMPTYFFWIKMALLGGFFMLIVAIPRGWCSCLCPIGAFFGLFNKVSIFNLQVDAEKCTECDECADACSVQLTPQTTRRSTECIVCGRCVDACPSNALALGWG